MPLDEASPICDAIRTLVLLEFDYDDLPRIVAPYLHGTKPDGVPALRAIQVGGRSRSRPIHSGKLFDVPKIRNLRLTATAFVPDDPRYNPDDSAFAQVHCRVPRLEGASRYS
jgi:hypothetical protein